MPRPASQQPSSGPVHCATHAAHPLPPQPLTPPPRSPYTRLVPRVNNLSVRGTLRLALAPLVPSLPGFGALMVSMARTPQVRAFEVVGGLALAPPIPISHGGGAACSAP